MKTVLHVGAHRAWTQALGRIPWPLLPLGNRPLLEYWLELSVDFGIKEVRLVLGEGADQIEAYAGDGSRWGLRIDYGFLRDDRRPLAFLQRAPEQWRDGLLFLSGPLFPRRLAESGLRPPAEDGLYRHEGQDGSLCAVCRDAAGFAALVGSAPSSPPARSFQSLGLDLAPVESAKDFFALNMRLAAGEMSRYLAPGYGSADGSCVGYNVILPPSAEVAPSVILGNDCRIGALASIGPEAVIGSHAVVDRQAQLQRCVILDGTYVGRQVELREKIAAGGRLIDPEDGVVLDLEDTWLLAGVAPAVPWRNAVRAAAGWVMALLMLCVQLVPFAVLYALVRLSSGGRFERRAVHGRGRRVVRMNVFRPAARPREPFLVRLFYALGLDLTPRMAGAVAGRWWLCGHEPLRAPEDNALREELTAYFPGVVSYATPRRGVGETAVTGVEARYYAHGRGVGEDAGILREAIVRRSMSVLGGDGNDDESPGDRG